MATAAPSCKKALKDATLRWPNRSRESDGLLPSAAHHKQNPKSDHETGRAFDLTDDPNAPKAQALVDQLVAANDRRVKYIIWNRRIWFPAANGSRPQGWSNYSGPNPHTHHFHVSIKPGAENDLSPWPWSSDASEATTRELTLPVVKMELPIVKRLEVKQLQERLKAHGFDTQIDGMFGLKTQRDLRSFQRARGITDDGIAGPFTWRELLKNKE